MSAISKLIPLFLTIPAKDPLTQSSTTKLNTANDKLAHPEVPLHPASPLITAAKELNPLVNGAVPDYKSTAIALAAQLLEKHGVLESVTKQVGNRTKDAMILGGVVQGLRPLVQKIRNNPFLWTFVPRDWKASIDMILRMSLPFVDDAKVNVTPSVAGLYVQGTMDTRA